MFVNQKVEIRFSQAKNGPHAGADEGPVSAPDRAGFTLILNELSELKMGRLGRSRTPGQHVISGRQSLTAHLQICDNFEGNSTSDAPPRLYPLDLISRGGPFAQVAGCYDCQQFARPALDHDDPFQEQETIDFPAGNPEGYSAGSPPPEGSSAARTVAARGTHR